MCYRGAIRIHGQMQIRLHQQENDTWLGYLEDPTTKDDAGALYYVIAVILIYGLSIFLMIASHMRKNKHDCQLRHYLKDMAALRKAERRDKLTDRISTLAAAGKVKNMFRNDINMLPLRGFFGLNSKSSVKIGLKHTLFSDECETLDSSTIGDIENKKVTKTIQRRQDGARCTKEGKQSWRKSGTKYPASAMPFFLESSLSSPVVQQEMHKSDFTSVDISLNLIPSTNTHRSSPVSKCPNTPALLSIKHDTSCCSDMTQEKQRIVEVKVVK